eukprot:GILK01003253.1.p1 GENE.GILK01003253.1~~GILK01003253.1.p1  ORF type:complete len:596 (-),score=86.89 GILK01003253.1:171-1913(-)
MGHILPELNTPLPYYCLALMFGLTFIVSIIRFVKVSHFRSGWDLTKFFCGLVLLHNFVRALTFGIVCFFENYDADLKGGASYEFLFTMLMIPDSVFLSTYGMLLLQYFRAIKMAHGHLGNTTYTLLGAPKPVSAFPWAPIVSTCLNVSLYTSQGILFYLFYIEVLQDRIPMLAISSVNIALVAFALFYIVYLVYSYSGYPYRSAASREKVKTLSWVMSVWTAGRAVRGILGLWYANNLNDFSGSDDALHGTAAIFIMVAIAMFLISEILPSLMVLDWSFVGLLLFSEEEAMGGESVSRHTQNITAGGTSWVMKPSDIQTFEEIGSREKGIGVVYRGDYKGKEVAVKVFKLQKLSKYVAEEVSSELDAVCTLRHQNILPTLGACLELPAVMLVMPSLPNRSLFHFLHSEQAAFILDSAFKIRVAREVAQALVFLHSQDPPHVHSHLTSHNIMIGMDNTVLVADVGLDRLKKYAGVVCGYSNKNAWTAPELLKEYSATTAGAAPSADVYSFGIILWELYTNTIPFQGMSVPEIRKCVVDGEYRPSIPPSTPSKYAELIRACWRTQPETRPNFAEIGARLEAL